MDFLTDTDTHMDSGWHDYQEVFDQLEDFEVASLNDELNWELAQ